MQLCWITVFLSIQIDPIDVWHALKPWLHQSVDCWSDINMPSSTKIKKDLYISTSLAKLNQLAADNIPKVTNVRM